MKQILQDLRNGKTLIAEIPEPNCEDGQILIKTTSSLISSGTEKMLVEFGKSNLVQKAMQQPEKVNQVKQKIKSDGFIPTLNAVVTKLGQPLPLGYCNVGRVMKVGNEVHDFNSGDRVVSNGHHAEVNAVGKNLCAKVPSNVSDEEASFTVIGAIALQSIRLLKPEIGETIAVIGLGLVGLITVQILRANGCKVIGLDFNKSRLDIANSFGVQTIDLNTEANPLEFVKHVTNGVGVDGVIISTASNSSKPISQAAEMCRKRGRLILVGTADLNISREEFFKKELTFQVSSSYGPGRYDKKYEEEGIDYPIGYVRWTENRNFIAVLDLISQGLIDVKKLISHRFELKDAIKAYDQVVNQNDSLGIILKYGKQSTQIKKDEKNHQSDIVRSEIVISNMNQMETGFIGAGNYAQSTLIPSFKKSGASISAIVTKTGISGMVAAKKFKIPINTTDAFEIIEHRKIKNVVIATQHNSHAEYCIAALNAGKNVFVEKPICLTIEELEKLRNIKIDEKQVLMVGFNRRFAPQIQKIKGLLDGIDIPVSFNINVNAGSLGMEHWAQQKKFGGGRVVGEVCHFIDLLRYLSASPIKDWQHISMTSPSNDTLSINIQFENGSIGNINYFSNGPKGLPKERLEIFADNKFLYLENFQKLVGVGWQGFKKYNLWRQDKGQLGCVQAFLNACQKTHINPIPLSELFEVALVSITIQNEIYKS